MIINHSFYLSLQVMISSKWIILVIIFTIFHSILIIIYITISITVNNCNLFAIILNLALIVHYSLINLLITAVFPLIKEDFYDYQQNYCNY